MVGFILKLVRLKGPFSYGRIRDASHRAGPVQGGISALQNEVNLATGSGPTDIVALQHAARRMSGIAARLEALTRAISPAGPFRSKLKRTLSQLAGSKTLRSQIEEAERRAKTTVRSPTTLASKIRPSAGSSSRSRHLWIDACRG